MQICSSFPMAHLQSTFSISLLLYFSRIYIWRLASKLDEIWKWLVDYTRYKYKSYIHKIVPMWLHILSLSDFLWFTKCGLRLKYQFSRKCKNASNDQCYIQVRIHEWMNLCVYVCVRQRVSLVKRAKSDGRPVDLVRATNMHNRLFSDFWFVMELAHLLRWWLKGWIGQW